MYLIEICIADFNIDIYSTYKLVNDQTKLDFKKYEYRIITFIELYIIAST